MKPLILKDVQQNKHVLECIKESDKALDILGYTDHGLRHLNLVADRARIIAEEIGLTKREQEMSAIASFCHDMGSFMGRDRHHYWGALLFYQIFRDTMDPAELAIVTQAIANHDKGELKFTNKVAAVLVLADKSDVHRSRVRKQPLKETLQDIHDRVNYGTLSSDLRVEHKSKRITLSLEIDTEFVPVLEYFEIFTERMSYCRKAAKHLGYQFGLVINNFQLI